MPYEIKLKHDLFNLFKVKVYKRVLQLIANTQLMLSVPNLIGEVYVKLFFLEPEANCRQENALLKESSKVHQI